MPIGRKLILAFSSLLILFLAFAASLVYLTEAMDQSYGKAIDISAKKLFLIGQIDTARADVRASLRATILYSYAGKADFVEANRVKTEEAFEKAQTLIQELKPLLESDEGRRRVVELSSQFTNWREKFEQIYGLCKENHPAEAEAYGTRETKSIAEGVGLSIKNLHEIQEGLFKESKELDHRRALIARTVAIVGLVLACIAGIVSLRTVWGVSATLRAITHDLSAGSEQVSSAAAQISASSQALAQGASEQAASLEETSSAAAEINSMTAKNAENSKNATRIVKEAEQGFEHTNGKLIEMVSSMAEINASSDKISRIIKTIDEIAFQTNILALNAAVEAARAGEAGMGFAVVAEEVRNLSQRCAQAAKETSGLIEESIANCRHGGTKLSAVETSIVALSAGAGEVKVLVEEVSLSCQEQARGLVQISNTIAQMEQVTQKTAASSEETAAAGAELNAQSESLHTIVKRLRSLVEGNSEDSDSLLKSWKQNKAPGFASRPTVRSTAYSIPKKEMIAPMVLEEDKEFQDVWK